jgi:DUF1680 family protein
LTLHQQTNYPWDGTVRLAVECDEPLEFSLHLRIPGWCKTARLTLNDEEIPLELRKGYARVTRTWRSGERLMLYLEMPVERIYPHPSIRENVGTVALRSGPLVYCVEGCDHPVPLHRIVLPASATFEKQVVPDLLNGVTVLRATARALETEDWDEALYRSFPPALSPLALTAIPYYAWDQREPGAMRVWLRTGGDA